MQMSEEFAKLKAEGEDAFSDHVISEVLGETERAAEALVKAEAIWAQMEALDPVAWAELKAFCEE